MRDPVRSIAFAILLACSGACSAGTEGPTGAGVADGCSDGDGDGFGVGASCRGPDCDDANPYAHHCADCSVDPQGTGCPCEGGEPVVCYDGPAETATFGRCVAGVRSCELGAWSSCHGQVLPTDEACNGSDDDCDGEADDGVQNSCGTCGAFCDEEVLGDESHPWDVSEAASGLVIEADGALSLDGAARLHPYIWIPNSRDSSVLKVDTRTYDELGRYRLVPGEGLPSPFTIGIAVNLESDVVVATALGAGPVPDGRVTRVNAEGCPDGPTSAGGDDMRPFGEDACVVWSTEIGGHAEGVIWEIRDVLDGIERYVWASDGLGGGRGVLELTEDGVLTGRGVRFPNATPPAALTIDVDGHLWVGTHGLSGTLVEIDPVEAERVASYSYEDLKYHCLTADGDGKVWIAGVWGRSVVFDQTTETFTDLEVPTSGGVTDESEETVWFGRMDGQIERVDRRDFDHEAHDIGFDDAEATAVYPAVDLDGMVWAVSSVHTTGHVFPPEDPEAFDVVLDSLLIPGACGDMTGIKLLEVVGPATYRHVFEGCETGETHWAAIRYEARFEGTSRIRFEVRTADTLSDLAAAPLVDVGVAPEDASPRGVAAALEAAGIPPAHLLEVQMTLTGGRGTDRPLLDEIAVGKGCEDAPD